MYIYTHCPDESWPPCTICCSLLQTSQNKIKIDRHKLLHIPITSEKFQEIHIGFLIFIILKLASKNNVSNMENAIVLHHRRSTLLVHIIVQCVYHFADTSLSLLNIFSLWLSCLWAVTSQGDDKEINFASILSHILSVTSTCSVSRSTVHCSC